MMTAQEFFKNDIFASDAGVELIDAREGYAKAQLKIEKKHLNAAGRTQGGALFTLADLALAACANSRGKLSFSLAANITFLRSSGDGDTLTAIATEKYVGRSTGYYEVEITDQENRLIASFSSSAFRTDKPVPFQAQPAKE
jgi:acyl-CoA thioesterase